MDCAPTPAPDLHTFQLLGYLLRNSWPSSTTVHLLCKGWDDLESPFWSPLGVQIHSGCP